MDGSRRLPGGTVALLFSDLEGSTQLLRVLGSAYAGVLSDLEGLLRGAFEAHGGELVDTQGDSFFVAFRRVGDAVAAAVAAQRALAEHPWPDGSEVRLRMGIHAGEPHVSEERYVGLGVHRAARICAAAHGGQVLLSNAAAAVLADSELKGIELRELGARSLKDFERPERLHQLVIAGLPSAFPPPRGVDEPLRQGARLQIRVLGPLEVEGAEGLVELGGNRQRSLLAALVLRAGKVVPTERLVDELWGSSPPKTALTSLQNAISSLRRSLGADASSRVRRATVSMSIESRSTSSASSACSRTRAERLRGAA